MAHSLEEARRLLGASNSTRDELRGAGLTLVRRLDAVERRLELADPLLRAVEAIMRDRDGNG